MRPERVLALSDGALAAGGVEAMPLQPGGTAGLILFVGVAVASVLGWCLWIRWGQEKARRYAGRKP